MQIILIVFTFILGTALGSFISVLNDRIIRNRKSIVFGRSACPKCKKRLTARDLVPLFSYIILKGKCRHCGKKISAHYPALEVITGLAFVSMFLYFPFLDDKLTVSWPALSALAIHLVYTVFLVAIFF